MQTFVKHLGYKSYKGGKAAKGVKAIKAHVKYIENRMDELGQRVERELFGKDGEMSRQDFYKTINEQKQQGVIAHKLVISMDRKDYEAQKIDLKELAKETMAVWEQKTGRQLNWIASIHDKASNPHVHIVVAGRDRAGKEVVFMKNHLEQLKRVSDKERQRLADRNINRERINEREPLKELDPMKQLSKERELVRGLEKGLSRVTEKGLNMALDRALTAFCPEAKVLKDIAKTITRGFGLER